MAASNSQLNFNLNGDARFRAIIQAVVAGLTAAGWTQASDTGQLNPTTVNRPVANTFATGYLLYAMGDSLQATVPVFLKLRFGCGSDAQTLAVAVSAGTVTDGAGTFSGTTRTKEYKLYSWRDPSDTVVNDNNYMYVSGGTSRFASALNLQTALASTVAQTMVMFAIERSHDATGADTSDGFSLLAYGQVSSDAGVSYAKFGSTVTEPTVLTSIPFGGVARTPIGSSGSIDNYVFSPIFPISDQFVNPLRGVLVAPNSTLLTNDYPATVSIDSYGAAHTFQGLKYGLAMLYE